MGAVAGVLLSQTLTVSLQAGSSRRVVPSEATTKLPPSNTSSSLPPT